MIGGTPVWPLRIVTKTWTSTSPHLGIPMQVPENATAWDVLVKIATEVPSVTFLGHGGAPATPTAIAYTTTLQTPRGEWVPRNARISAVADACGCSINQIKTRASIMSGGVTTITLEFDGKLKGAHKARYCVLASSMKTASNDFIEGYMGTFSTTITLTAN
eukprot:TRINITY_DN21670_c0_g1_i1.p1 TRINITY_DN21670_c0_g1~~TRINITY_DN21670_c0_g1_i1.p1  ORF type:complete len:161 (-),score=16.88 TRINITY_DN21670_c0_g1_i1:86-568(-)